MVFPANFAKNIVNNYGIKDYVECEYSRKYEMLITNFKNANVQPLVFLEKLDGVFLNHPERGFNKSSNPIIHSLKHRNGLSEAVYALIENHHIENGRDTGDDQRMALGIREQGYKIDDVPVDLCGQIISPKLGGRMEKQNLFPVSKTENIYRFILAEAGILKHIKEKKKHNGRAYLRIGLEYNDPKYSCRPTKLYYNYLLFSDDINGLQKAQKGEINVDFDVHTEDGKLIQIREMDSKLAKHKSTVKAEQIISETERKYAEQFEGSSLEEWIKWIRWIPIAGPFLYSAFGYYKWAQKHKKPILVAVIAFIIIPLLGWGFMWIRFLMNICIWFLMMLFKFVKIVNPF